MSDPERVALERDDARELHREVVRHLVEQIAELTRERDRALACEAAARGLLAALSSPPSPTSAPGGCPGCAGCADCDPSRHSRVP